MNMKFFAAIAIAMFLTTQLCRAETAIYQFVGLQTVYGAGNVQRVTIRGHAIYEPETQELVVISAFSLVGQKIFGARVFLGHRIDRAEGSRGSSYTIISMASAPSSEFADVLMESVHLRGKNGKFSIGNAGLREIPKTFTMSARNVVKNPAGTVFATGESTGTLKLDVSASRYSNTFETFDATVERLKTYYIARGFILSVPRPITN